MKQTKKTDLLCYIRNGKALTSHQKILLVIRLSIPGILAQITSIIMQYIDASMVGHLSANASASIGLVTTTIWLFGGISSSISAGFYIQVAQYIGAKEYEKSRAVLKQSLCIVTSFSILLSLIGFSISSFLPMWMGGDPVLYKDSISYFRIFVFSVPFMSLNSLAGGMLQCSGNMKIPSLLNSLMCILDVIFNGFLIFSGFSFSLFGKTIFIPGLSFGVMGAALGTALAEVVISIFMLYFLLFRSPFLAILTIKDSNPVQETKKFHYINKAVRISLPITFERLIMSAAYIASTKIIAPLGITAIAAHSFSITAESLCYMPGYGIAEASTTLIGQSIGAGRKNLAYSFGKMTTCLGMLIMTVTGFMMYLFAPFMIGLLTPDFAVKQLAVQILRIEAFAEPLYGASIVITGILRGAGDTLLPSIMNFISMWGVRIPFSYLLSTQYGLVGVWIVMCGELCFRGIIFLIRFLRKRWLNSNELKLK